MDSTPEITLYRIFKEHYGKENAEEIVICIKGVLTTTEAEYHERLIRVFVKVGWKEQDARYLDELLTEMKAQKDAERDS